MQTDATRTCELLVGLRDVTVLSVNAGYVEDIEDSTSDNASTTKRTALVGCIEDALSLKAPSDLR